MLISDVHEPYIMKSRTAILFLLLGFALSTINVNAQSESDTLWLWNQILDKDKPVKITLDSSKVEYGDFPAGKLKGTPYVSLTDSTLSIFNLPHLQSTEEPSTFNIISLYLTERETDQAVIIDMWEGEPYFRWLLRLGHPRLQTNDRPRVEFYISNDAFDWKFTGYLNNH